MTKPSADVEQDDAAIASGNPEPTVRRPYILVAEDNEVNRIFFSQILEAAGLDFTLVGNGEEAVAAWQRETPLVVLMDTAMPVLDGFAATARIRAIEAASGGRTPIIGVIAHMQESERELCLSSGMDDYVIKPITPERLEDKIRQWLGEDVLSIAGKQDRF